MNCARYGRGSRHPDLARSESISAAENDRPLITGSEEEHHLNTPHTKYSGVMIVLAEDLNQRLYGTEPCTQLTPQIWALLTQVWVG